MSFFVEKFIEITTFFCYNILVIFFGGIHL